MIKGSHHTKEVKDKISAKKLGKTLSEQAKINIGLGQKGKKLSKETRKKISLARIGMKFTKEHCDNMSKVRIKTPQRFWSKIEIGDFFKCWNYKGTITRMGYGQFCLNGKVVLAHRYMWQLCFDDLPDDVKVLHKCDNPKCVNPYHLFCGSSADNIADMVRKKRHSFGENHGMAKLKESDVLQIRSLSRSGKRICDLVRQFKVSDVTIGHIIKRKLWKHI